jgi:hypothetical protein
MARRARPLPFSVVAHVAAAVLAFASGCARVEPPHDRPAPPPSLPADVEQLRGLPAPDIARLLGEPDFVREEPPAVIWQYRSADCVLDLFFYRGGDELRVAYAEARDRGLIRVSQSDCYADLVAGRARPL